MYKIFKIIFFANFCFFSTLIIDVLAQEKIKVGLLVPMSGENQNLGRLIIKSTSMALKDINTEKLEIYPKDTGSSPTQTLKSAKELQRMGINVVIGPIFYKNLIYLDEVENITFLSLTNKTINLPKNVISTGINATSQLKSIKKFVEKNDLKKTIFLTPKLDYEIEIKKAIKDSKIKILQQHIYETEPTKLTKQIEKITNYKTRKQNLADEIRRIEKLKKKYTIGNLKFDSVIISDFDESLKSVITSLLYTDVSPKNKYIITFNQWFEESLLSETALQPIYYPSINSRNLKEFNKKFLKKFNEQPNHLSLLSYDLIGLIYYLSLEEDLSEMNKIFKKKNSFKGKIGIFDILNNKIHHRLNFYKIENKKIKEIF